MKVKCFACNEPVEADDVAEVVDRFVVHGEQDHDWPYPEEAVRNYARNYAEATLRLTGSEERLPEIGDLGIHPVAEESVDDWLQFFDHDAFAGNADWASCYCLEPHDPPSPDLPERPWRDTRDAMIERIRSGGTYGYLAYVEGRTAGWVNASLRSDYGLYGPVEPDGPDASSVIGVSCYVVAPPFRRHGVASRLLDRTIADAPGRGASWVEAYPFNDPEESETQHHFRGPRPIYDARGFGPVEIRERDTVVRRAVS